MAYKYAYSPGVEGDRRLLPHRDYDSYLDSLVQTVDLRNLRSFKTARTIAWLGYRSTGEILLENEFYPRRAVIQEAVAPKARPFLCVGQTHTSSDPLVVELAKREYNNRINLLQTIIFIRHRNKVGFEVSGYIDYAERLLSHDLSSFFDGTARLTPLKTDLCYFDWKNDNIVTNVSRNWKPVTDYKIGLLMENRHDLMTVSIEPDESPGINTTRTRIRSDRYRQIELFDHMTRRVS